MFLFIHQIKKSGFFREIEIDKDDGVAGLLREMMKNGETETVLSTPSDSTIISPSKNSKFSGNVEKSKNPFDPKKFMSDLKGRNISNQVLGPGKSIELLLAAKSER